jgi:hypothetical protein
LILQKKFLRHFRASYDEFKDFVAEAKAPPLFERWEGHDAAGNPSSPIELLLLGSLRYLGRGWTFDDIEEATCISREVHRTFFRVFISWGSTFLFEKYFIAPSKNDEAKHHGKKWQLLASMGLLVPLTQHMSVWRNVQVGLVKLIRALSSNYLLIRTS